MKENTLLLRRNSVQNLFNGYYYDNTIAAMAGAKLSHINPESQNTKTDGKLKYKIHIIMIKIDFLCYQYLFILIITYLKSI